MSSNYPEGSMRGSGIYGESVEYDEFVCENEECGKTNEGSEVITDDWGNYRIECEFCGAKYRESSLSDDADDARADEEYDEY